MDLHITPASHAEPQQLRELFGAKGIAARCQCQRYRLEPGESFASSPAEVRAYRLAEQAGCGDPTGPSSGLVARLGTDLVGWCAVGPRVELTGLTRGFTVPWQGRDEDKADPGVWALSCVFVPAGRRRRGVATALVSAAVDHARTAGATALEGYPITRTDVLTEELHVGTVGMFADAGFAEVSAPTLRRVVMRIDFPRPD